MPTVRVDKNAHQILIKIRDELKEQGINAVSFSDAIRNIYARIKK